MKVNNNTNTSPEASAWKCFLKLFYSPTAAWHKIALTGLNSDLVARTVLYPLIALSSALEFLRIIYNTHATVAPVLQTAVITFISWFAGYFCVVLAAQNICGATVKKVIDSACGKTFVMMCMATLVVFYIIYELIPILEPLIVFTPLYTIFLITKGVAISGIEEDKTLKVSAWFAVLIIGIPIVIQQIFETIMPQAA